MNTLFKLTVNKKRDSMPVLIRARISISSIEKVGVQWCRVGNGKAVMDKHPG